MKLAWYLGIFSTLLVAGCSGSSMQCGIATTTEATGRHRRLIVDGETTDVKKWPWQVILYTYNNASELSQCGGTIISDRWILTAAHCLEIHSSTIIFAGVSDKMQIDQQVDKGGPHRAIQRIPHSNYNDTFKMNDIALLKLDRPLIFGETISPICLANGNQQIPDNGDTVATGFGDTNIEGKEDEKHLREVESPIVNGDECALRWMNSLGIYEKFNAMEYTPAPEEGTKEELLEEVAAMFKEKICAGTVNHGVLEGDSGGPLMMKATDGRWIQIGVTSFGHEDPAQDKLPSMFTDVRRYCNWIEETTQGDAKCQDHEVTLVEEIEP